jgi:hypothetical protein
LAVFLAKKTGWKTTGTEGELPSPAVGGGIFSKISFLRLRGDYANPILSLLVKFFTSSFDRNLWATFFRAGPTGFLSR